jgi:hypothetical protein
MRSASCLIVGIVVGAAMQTALGQQREIVSLNHVAIAVPDFEAASRFYSEGMGFPQAFAFKEPNGSPSLSYFQLDGLVKRLRAVGMDVRDPIVSSRTRTRFAVARTPQGTVVELLEFGPDSLHRRVMEAWK